MSAPTARRAESALGRLPALLRAVRRRLRIAWALDTVQLVAPLLALVALAVVATAWITPWIIGAERLAIGIAAVVLVTIGAAAIALRLPDQTVARAADRGLQTKDAFATALEVGADAIPFGQRVHARAAALAGGASAKDAVTMPWRRRPVTLAAVVAPLVVVLAVVTGPGDHRRAEQARDSALVAAAIDEVEEAAAELADEPQSADAVRRLDALAEELAQTSEPAEAEELLRRQAAEIDPGADPEALAERAATQGLERSLGTEPLPGSTTAGPAAEQFAQLGDELASMDEQQQEVVAERLDALAETQQAGDPQAAAALAAAAEALRGGDAEAAAAALGEAAAAHRAASGRAAASAALGEASAAARRAADGLAGQGQGQGQGQGRGQGQGQGQDQGQGQGQGQGSGQGQGQGGGGNPSGNVSGATSDGSGASGQGGRGQAVGGGNAEIDPEQAPDLATIFDPAHGTGGDELTVGGGQGAGEGGAIGTTDGPTGDGASHVALDTAVTDYADQATSAMDRAVVAPSDRQLVTDYFDELQHRR